LIQGMIAVDDNVVAIVMQQSRTRCTNAHGSTGYQSYWL